MCSEACIIPLVTNCIQCTAKAVPADLYRNLLKRSEASDAKKCLNRRGPKIAQGELASLS